MSFIEFLKNFRMKYPYKYVEPCPECGSRCTGRYMKQPLTETDKEYIEVKSYENGEIIRFSSKEPVLNAFCVDCGHRWSANIKTILLTKQEIETEILARGTEMALVELNEEISTKNSISGHRKNGFF